MTEHNPQEHPQLLQPQLSYDMWADGLAEDDVNSDRAAADRARIGAVLGLDDTDAEVFRLRLMTSPLDRRVYAGAVFTAAEAENAQRDKEDTDEKTHLLNEQGIRHWVRRQFQLPPDETQDRRTSTSEARITHAAVLFGDLCNFKLINDVFGHDGGDVLLKVAAKKLPEQIRFRQVEPHAAARLHGDEYLAVVQGISPEDSQKMLERLQAVQLEKLSSENAQAFWRRVRNVASGKEQHEKGTFNRIDPETGRQDVYVKLGDIELPADQAAIFSLGMSHGEITRISDLDHLKGAADETQTKSKEAIHEAMGGAYRGANTEVRHGFRAVPMVAINGLKTWAIRRRDKGNDK